jgi:hypothetical protein
VGPRHAHDALSDVWDVHWRPAQGQPLHTRYAVLRWDDIVLRHWGRGLRRVLADWRLMYLRRGPCGRWHASMRRRRPASGWATCRWVWPWPA